MSVEAMLWAMHDAPVADTTERLILIALGDRANPDGTSAFPSRRTMAQVALCDEKTVQRKLRGLRERGLIAPGDQAAARYIPAHVRPRVYDLLIPAAWYGSERLARVNEDRAQRGLPPITQESRPEIAAPPPRRRRSDAGKRRGRAQESPPEEGGDSQSPRGGLSVPRTSPITPQ